MTTSERQNRTTLVVLTSHWVSRLGVALVTTAGISWLFVLPAQLRGNVSNPYIGIIVFLLLPIVFVSGLVLIPVGVFLGRRRVRKGLTEAIVDPKVALRRFLIFLGATTAANVIIGTQVTYRAVAYMETVQFCGSSCHAHRPEYAAYQESPHSRVECVECHVVPGAAGWVESKINGMRQLVETTFNTYPRPIPSAMESNRLVPARETCERCHWPQKMTAIRIRVYFNFKDDAANSPTQTVLLMHVGGGRTGGVHGAHVGPGIQIRYAAADTRRQTLPWVEYRNDVTGVSRTYLAAEATAESVKGRPVHTMQCVDCHNRPAHTFQLPGRVIDRALALGEIASTLPFVKRKGVELLEASYASNAAARREIPAALEVYYQRDHPQVFAQRASDVATAAEALVAIYDRNVFPDLKVGWGTYPNNLGHTDFPGCFRCHDGAHVSAVDEKEIPQDCNKCHEALAIEEVAPAILETLGVTDLLKRLRKQ